MLSSWNEKHNIETFKHLSLRVEKKSKIKRRQHATHRPTGKWIERISLQSARLVKLCYNELFHRKCKWGSISQTKTNKNYGHVLSPEEECTALRGKFSALQRTYSLPLNIKLLSSRHFSENISLPYQSLYMGFWCRDASWRIQPLNGLAGLDPRVLPVLSRKLAVTLAFREEYTSSFLVLFSIAHSRTRLEIESVTSLMFYFPHKKWVITRDHDEEAEREATSVAKNLVLVTWTVRKLLMWVSRFITVQLWVNTQCHSTIEKNALSSLNIGRHSVGEIIGRLNSKIGGLIV